MPVQLELWGRPRRGAARAGPLRRPASFRASQLINKPENLRTLARRVSTLGTSRGFSGDECERVEASVDVGFDRAKCGSHARRRAENKFTSGEPTGPAGVSRRSCDDFRADLPGIAQPGCGSFPSARAKPLTGGWQRRLRDETPSQQEGSLRAGKVARALQLGRDKVAISKANLRPVSPQDQQLERRDGLITSPLRRIWRDPEVRDHHPTLGAWFVLRGPRSSGLVTRIGPNDLR
jgi:hypothetical protein